MPKQKNHLSARAVEARRTWLRKQLHANPYRHTFSGPDNLLDAMRKKFGVTMDTATLGTIKKEVLAELGLTTAQVTSRQRTDGPTLPAKHPPGKHVEPELRARGMELIAQGKSKSEIMRALRVGKTTVDRWRQDARKGKSAPMAFLGKQLATMAKMLREALPDVTRLVLTATEDGGTAVEYTVRQTSEISGQVKL